MPGQQDPISPRSIKALTVYDYLQVKTSATNFILSYLKFLASYISLEFPEFCFTLTPPEAETELEVRLSCLRDLLDAGLVGKEEIIQPVGHGIVEESGHPEEAFATR